MSIVTQIFGIAAILAGLTYASLILLFTFGWKRLGRMGNSVRMDFRPTVSIVIAARNERDQIPKLLDDLSRQDYPSFLMEVIVVDDFSADGTVPEVKDFVAQRGLSNFKLYQREGIDQRGSKKKAITQGVYRANGEIILTTDADCRLSTGWTRTMVRYFNRESIRMVAGPVACSDKNSLSGRFQALEFLGLVGSGAGAIGAGQPFLCNGACLAYRKQAFLDIKGYEGNERFRSGDDVFLMHKIKKLYGKDSISFALDDEAIVNTRPAADFSAFIRQRVRWASKSRGYRDAVALLTAASVFFLSLISVVVFIGGFFHPQLFLLFAAIIFFKTIIDYRLLRRITTFTGNRHLMFWLIPFQGIYPFYVLLAGIGSFWKRGSW